MDAYAPLLKEDPHTLAPDIDLTKNIATNEIVKEKSRCEKCGKVLNPLDIESYLDINIDVKNLLRFAESCYNSLLKSYAKTIA